MRTARVARTAAVVFAALQFASSYPGQAETLRGKLPPSAITKKPQPQTAQPEAPTISTKPNISKLPLAGLSITSPAVLPSGTPGEQYQTTLAAAGGKAPYAWSIAAGNLPAGLTLVPVGDLQGTPTAKGSFSFTVRATDSTAGKQLTVTKTFTLDIVPGLTMSTLPNLPPATQGQSYNVAVGAAGGTSPYTWSVNTGPLPAGLGLSSAGVLSGTPTATGNFSFKIAVKDSRPGAPRQAVQPFTLTVNAQGANLSLAVTTANPLPDAKLGQVYSKTLAATGGVPPYKWSYGGGSVPSGLGLSPDGVLSGTPNGVGASTFTVQVKDSSPGTAQAAFSPTYTLNVAAPPLAIASPSPLPNAPIGKPYNQTLAVNGGVPPYTWSVSGGALPAGLSLSSVGVLSGTPTTPGNNSFTLHVADSSAGTPLSENKALSLSVVQPLVITTAPTMPNATVSQPYNQTMMASGGTPPYKWSVVQDGYGGLPNGITLAQSGAVSGTSNQPNKYIFTAKVTDSAGSSPAAATQTTTLWVMPPPLVLLTANLPPPTEGQAYNQSLAATGGIPPYKWSVSAGALPSGLTLSSAGVLSGSATASGNVSVTFEVTDGSPAPLPQGTASKQLTIAVAVQSGGTTLPAAIQGQAYNQTLSSSSGSPPFAWSLIGGSLPNGLSLSPSGVISGTVNDAAGNRYFTLWIKDASASTHAQYYDLPVKSTLAITTPVLNLGKQGQAFSETMAASGGIPPYTWHLHEASTPTIGLSLSSSGILSGTPPATGNYSLTITVQDSLGEQMQKDFLLRVSTP